MSDDLIKEAQDIFRQCEERDRDNRAAFEDDIRFARLEEQWPDEIARQRQDEGRPMHTINKLAGVIRQVVNEARQNKPSITIRPQDNASDPETAEILTGLVRNIESSSNADIAYDTAVENAVSGGFGYIRVNIEYSHDDTFDKDIVIDRVANPLSVYGDPESFSPDGSDWNTAFITDQISRAMFAKKYKGADEIEWEGADYPEGWTEGDNLTIAEWWMRDEVRRDIIQLSDGQVIGLKEFKQQAEYFYSLGLEPVGEPRSVASYKTTQRIITGAEVLETNEWPGCYIPIVPVYGDEVILKNKRYWRSLIRSARSAQERYNYWMSAATEMVALAPKVPYIGPEGAFDVDIENWTRANKESIPFLQYRGPQMPQRQASPQISPAMMQEAMNAAEDIKAVTGIYDASLGARSNETSGIAINARKQQGNLSTFHFVDNLTRSIRQVGRIVVDLVPRIYTQDRVIRVLGQDGKSDQVTLGQPNETGRIYDLSAGKYDVVAKSGPSYTTQREETRQQLVDIIRAVPESARILGPMYLRNSDWPGAEEAADLLEGKGEQDQGVPPQVQQQMMQMQQALQQGGQQLSALQQENAVLKREFALKQRELEIKDKEANIKAVDAQTRARQAETEATRTQFERLAAAQQSMGQPIAPVPPTYEGAA